jgi:hypothetical protein
MTRDFYRLPLSQGVEARSFGLQLGLVRCRLFWARLGDKLYIASQPYILEELAAKLTNDDGASAIGRDVPDLKAHAMIRIRPRRWNQALPAYRLGWAERHRQACLDNVCRLSSVARVVNGGPAAPAAAPHDPATELDRLAAQLYGVQFYCPEGGAATSAKEMPCTVRCTVPRSSHDNGPFQRKPVPATPCCVIVRT